MALLAAATALSLAQGSAAPRGDGRVALVASAGASFGYVRLKGDGFEASRTAKKGDLMDEPKNFRRVGRCFEIDDRYLGRDPEGKSREVVAVNKITLAAQWEKMSDKRGKLLRVPAGPQKGWFVGLAKGVLSEDGRTIRFRLILVEDRKDAAAFKWTSKEDESSP